MFGARIKGEFVNRIVLQFFLFGVVFGCSYRNVHGLSSDDIKNLSDFDLYNYEEGTILHHSIRNGWTSEAIQKILERDPGLLEAVNKEGQTPLAYAIIYEYEDKAYKVLIDHGANVHAKDRKGNTILHYLAMQDYWHRFNHKNFSVLNIEVFQDIKIKNNKGYMPIEWSRLRDLCGENKECALLME